MSPWSAMCGKLTFGVSILIAMKRISVHVAAVAVFLSGCGFAPAGTDSRPKPPRWKRTPSSEEITRCQPSSTDLPDGTVHLRCRVGAAGELDRCVVLSASDPRLGDWSLCMSASFVAGYAEIGREVELPFHWRR